MDYEKKYKEALEWVRKVIQGKVGFVLDEVLEKFPELKESEDEKIRKSIISIINNYVDNSNTFKPKMIAWLEKQGEQSIKWNKNTEGNKPQVNHSVLMKTTHGIAEGEWQGEYWHQYRWAGIVRDSDVLSWMELSDLEKQCGQKPADKVEPKFKVGQMIKKEGFNLGFIIVKIEDGFYYNDMGDYFPFTDQDNWELVEQDSPWSEEDEKRLTKVLVTLNDAYASKELLNWVESLKGRVQPQPVWSKEDDETLCKCISATFDHGYLKECDWLKSFRPQSHWKPSDEQIKAVKEAACYSSILSEKTIDNLVSLSKQLKKLSDE